MDKKRTRAVRITAIVSILVVLILACATGGFFMARSLWSNYFVAKATPVPIPVDRGAIVQLEGGQATQAPAQLVSIRISEGQAEPQLVEALTPAAGEPLSPGEIEQILARLPALPTGAADQVEFKLPEELLPPPRAGVTIQEQFPALEPVPTPEVGEPGPLKVLRYAPEGEAPIAPFVSVTFNQPMVPLGTLADLAALDAPVQIEPALPGTWRWLGTKTLTFEYDSSVIDRLPKATQFRVRVPAGTKSQTGGELAETVEWTFTTPPPVMVSYYPSYGPQRLDPVFFVAFDQRIDPSAVLETIQVTAGGNPVQVNLASEGDIAKDEQVSQIVKYTLEGRWLAFRAAASLPTDASITVSIGPGTPSAEGPLVTSQAQSFSFSTYAPLRIEDHGCSWSGDKKCPPLSPFYIRFNNTIDAQVYTDTMLLIEPALAGASVSIYGNTLEIRGATTGQTTYKVTVDGGIQDIFSQTLGEAAQISFSTGTAEPALYGPNQILVTVDPAAAKPAFSIYAMNYTRLNVKIYAVQPSDWPGFKLYLREYQQTDTPPELPGRLVFDGAIRPDAPTDVLTQVDIDLSKYLAGGEAGQRGYGHFIVVVAPPKGLFQNESDIYWRTIHAWVQVTQIGLDALTDHSEMLAWATALKDGAPLAGVTIQPSSGGAAVTTSADGVARFPIPSGATYLLAKQGADTALLPRSADAWYEDTWYPSPPSDELRWYVFDDRQMYKPGEEVHIKGWLRRIGGLQNGDVGLVGDAVTSVNYQITDPQGNDLGNSQVEVNPLGGFDFAFTLPQQVNLGYAQIRLVAQGGLGSLSGTESYHSFQIQEFRRPEFEVITRNETSGPYFAGDYAVMAVEAKYYAGGSLPNADVTWNVTYSPSSYSPPNWSDFTFGVWQPWWWYSGGYDYGSGGGGETQTFTGKTDASGIHYLRVDFDQTGGSRPLSVLAQSTVMDVNRQAWSGATSLLVHPASLYVGLRSDRYFVERGAPLKVDFIVADLDGNPAAGRPVELRAARLDWKYRGGQWLEEEADVQICNLTSALEPATCTFETPLGGTYRITASVTDAQGRLNQSQITRWVSGGQQPTSRKVEQEQVNLIPDRETYQPGDVAQILVQAPFSPAEGLLTVSRSGILYTERFTLQDGTATLSIPIAEQHIPNLNIQVDVVGSAVRTSDQGDPLPDVPARPAYAAGSLTLRIPPLTRTLSVEAIPASSELEPGAETSILVSVRDANGQPIPNAEVALVVVDEAVLALTNYQLSDPISLFYSDRPSYLSSIYGRGSIILVDPQALAGEGGRQVMETVTVDEQKAARQAEQPSVMGLPAATQSPAASEAYDAAQNAPNAPINMRADFNPLAAFAPTVQTDAQGQARIPIKLPDNLTRYRVMAVAVSDDGRQFGTGESSLTARLPLMVRPSAPRFLNFGDRFELPVVVQNQTGEQLVVEVVVRAGNLELTNANGTLTDASSADFPSADGISADVPSAAGLRVIVPAYDRVEVRFPATTRLAGTARLQIAAVSGAYSDAATVELPVYTPATTEAFATYGVLDEGVVFQPVLAPSGVFPQYGGLEIGVSSTALQALTDAVLYLVAYPYECSEQLASRILAVAGLRDVLTAFQADGLPSPQEMEAAVTRDIERLKGMQNPDGGFPYWRRGFESIPFNTIHVAHALYRAQSKGFELPAEMQQSALAYLGNIESYYPAWYGSYTRWTLSAYALYVRNLSGDRDPQKASNLLNEAGLENLPMEAIGWLWPVIEDDAQLEAIRTFVGNRVVETAGAANFTTYYDEQTYLLLSSDRRTDAILLDALMGDNPESDLIPKVVNGLLAHRTKGRWGNTQENVFVLLALDRYFNTFEAQTPDFVAHLWLGETYAGSSEFRGRTTERHETVIPMPYVISETLAAGGMQNLILSKDGPGRLYYRLGLRYAPTDLNLPPLNMGFVVARRYEAVDNPEDVYQDGDGVWHIRAGARVRVRISMVADNRRYHVALVDPLPAGLEIVNPALAVAQSTPQDPNSTDYRYGWWWWGTWYEHQNMRDERAEAFTSLLWEGVYEYTYIARATTPGVFIVPPAKAEEMYSPEVFGRSASDWVVVEDR